ncbi:MAG: 3-methyl-2-oxobutanoate hydroxymethyltransferase [Alphaproteobacteria bacterium]|nr:3-methyl-2-oxobutanoate hydroxymethyltransferase [Alphaproteobacteria bacterium]
MSAVPQIQRLTVSKIRARKGGDPIVCLTAYTAPIAHLLDSFVDLILVGDSAAMVVHGHETTLPITLDLMIAHAQAVMRGSTRALVVLDLPFGSYEQGPEQAFASAARAMKEAHVGAVKLEGGQRVAPTIAFLTGRGVPVVAHIGLLPQSVQAAGYRTTGRRRDEWAAIIEDAKAVADAGAFAVVLEGMAEPLAAEITKLIRIPTIGIGASANCDGQILVTEDLLGLTMSGRVPSFVRRYADLNKVIGEAVAAYAADVKARRFPAVEHTYALKQN